MEDSEAPKTPEISKSLSRELEEVISKQNLLTSRTRRRVLMSLQEQTNTEEDAEMEKLRQKAIDEIINSEKKIKFDAVDTWLGSSEHQKNPSVKNKTLYT